jgi:uncharacterized protein YbbK (DUF523 family)
MGSGHDERPSSWSATRLLQDWQTADSNLDITDRMLKFADARVRDLLKTGLHGFVFKARSPFCGLTDVAAHNIKTPSEDGRGLFASVVTQHCPALPVENEIRLQNRGVRDQFIQCVLEDQKRSCN